MRILVTLQWKDNKNQHAWEERAEKKGEKSVFYLCQREGGKRHNFGA